MENIENTKEWIDRLLQKNHEENDINYGGFRANHIVHGVYTLYSLGASKERIQEYYESYLNLVEPLRESKFLIDESNWENYISDKTAYAELLPFFDEQLKTHGIEKCLMKFIPRLLPGFVGALYHPLLHIGFGVEYGFPGAVAEGLSYASTYYYKVGEIINRLAPDDGTASVEPLDLLEEMKHMNLKLCTDHCETFQIDKVLNYHEAEVRQLASKWKIDADSEETILEKLTELTRAALIVTFGSYQRQTIDFFFMHNVTVLQAVRVLLPYLSLEEQKRLLQVNLVGLLSNFWLQGLPDYELERALTYGGDAIETSWDTVVKTCMERNEEHVIKVVRTLGVIKDSIPDTKIPHELLHRAGVMTTDFIKQLEDWEFDGIGYDDETRARSLRIPHTNIRTHDN